MDTVKIVRENGSYFLETAEGRVELKFAKGKEGKVLRLPKNPSNRKKFSVSQMKDADEIELTFKPQNTEPREFSLISKKLLKYATPEQLERIKEITAATKAAYDADKATHSTRAVKEVTPEVAAEMLPKLEKKYAAMGRRIAAYKAIIEGNDTNMEVNE